MRGPAAVKKVRAAVRLLDFGGVPPSMTNLLKLGLPLSLVLSLAPGCDDEDDESSSTGASSGTTGEASTGGSDTGIATTPPTTGSESSDDTGIATTPPTTGSSEDTGIATTPPTTGTDSSGSADTGDEEGVRVEVTYAFTAELAGVPLDCTSAEASLVDVYVIASDDPDRAMWDLQELPCDDTAIEVGPLPPGTYDLQVVAWSPALWEGSTGAIEIGPDAAAVTVDLIEVPKR